MLSTCFAVPLLRGRGAMVMPPLTRRRIAASRPQLVMQGMRSFYDDAVASGPNALYLESIYTQWKSDASRVDPRWDEYFQALEAGMSPATQPAHAQRLALEARTAATTAALIPSSSHTSERLDLELSTDRASPYLANTFGLSTMLRAFQARGHEVANLDPLGHHQWRNFKRKAKGNPGPDLAPRLAPSQYGFGNADLDKIVSPKHLTSVSGGDSGFLSSVSLPRARLTLREVITNLQATYCGTMGIEYMHIASRQKRDWIMNRVENPTFLEQDRDKIMKIYERLCEADSLERFLGEAFKTAKRFGVDGGEALIPGMGAMVDKALELGAEEFVIGMPHRGRLNVLVNILRKPLPQLFAEFQGTAVDVDTLIAQAAQQDYLPAADVKYHLGTSHTFAHADGRSVTLTLEANPSHLETVAPVTLGRTLAKQYHHEDGDDVNRYQRIVPIVLHGDASFAGQGVCYETLQLAQVDDFFVGGTVHVVLNNQMGFTTNPKNSRSTTYCSDLGKAFGIPIFHCNGDDPEAVVRAFELATEWRQAWGLDVILDIICYRRFGHNEIDNPGFTQPVLYNEIANHRRTEQIMADDLMKRGIASAEEIDHVRSKIWGRLETDFEASSSYQPQPYTAWLPTKWAGFHGPETVAKRVHTGVDITLLRKIGERLCEVPKDFRVHSGIRRILKAKRETVDAGTGLDWGTAEALAIGTLLLEGHHVRLTGQDVQRGTFSHRHCVLLDQHTEDEFCFLNNLGLGQQASFVVRNSILSEYAVLGFECGYSYEDPNVLVLWEAQFGDFANTAQVMLDQFISAGEHKWLQQTGITLLMPHGYDGQGAEHSSCRLERFLQLCDDDEDDIPDYSIMGSVKQQQKQNMHVMNLSTPANYFHALRKQIHRDHYRKPLIIASPKALLRHKACVSSYEDMGPDSKLQRVIGERDPAISADPTKIERLVFCTGKIYYELESVRKTLGLTNVAIVTVECLSPFPFDIVKEELLKYKNVDPGDGVHPGNIAWCQEEPKNMGAWSYVRSRFVTVAREALGIDLVMCYVGRRAAAAPATGLGKVHAAEQEAVVREALLPGGREVNEIPRGSALLGHQT